MSDRVSFVPLSHSLEAGTVGQTAAIMGTRRDNGGTPSLKSLALKVLRRDKGRDTSGTKRPIFCPSFDEAVGQNLASVPSETQPLLMPDGRRPWRWRADEIPPAISDAARALADKARRFGSVLVADGLDLLLVEPSMSELPDEVRDGLAANAGMIIALLRGESRVRTGTGQPDGA